MEYKTGNWDEIIVESGKDILQTIDQYIINHAWKNVVVVNAIGSVKDLIFATPIRNELPLKVGSTPCLGAAEILSFTGEIMSKELMDEDLKEVYPKTNSPLFIHIHASCARAGGQVMGGGLRGGKAFRKLRIFIHPLY